MAAWINPNHPLHRWQSLPFVIVAFGVSLFLLWVSIGTLLLQFKSNAIHAKVTGFKFESSKSGESFQLAQCDIPQGSAFWHIDVLLSAAEYAQFKRDLAAGSPPILNLDVAIFGPFKQYRRTGQNSLVGCIALLLFFLLFSYITIRSVAGLVKHRS